MFNQEKIECLLTLLFHNFTLFREFCLVYNFIQSGDFYPVQILLSSQKAFICRDFYRVQRLSYSADTFIQLGDFYLVWRLLTNVETFIQLRDFYSTQETFIQYGDFYLVWRFLSSVETFFPNQTAKEIAQCLLKKPKKVYRMCIKEKLFFIKLIRIRTFSQIVSNMSNYFFFFFNVLAFFYKRLQIVVFILFKSRI